MFVKSVSRIIEDEIGISPTNSISTHKRKYVEARQIFTTLICKYSKKSLREVGDLIKRDHSTVIHSKMVVSNLYDTDINYRERYNRIEHRVKLLK
jgi:chromosomal replication initiator protein